MPKFNFGTLAKESKKDLDSQEKKTISNEIIPRAALKKVTLGEDDQKVAHAQLSKKVPKSNSSSKKILETSETLNGEIVVASQTELINQKIINFDLRIEKKFNEFNERQLKLIRSGLEHELTIDNLIDYIKTHNKKTKLYKLVDFFKPAEPADIERMFKYLYQTKIIGRTQDNWYYLK